MTNLKIVIKKLSFLAFNYQVLKITLNIFSWINAQFYTFELITENVILLA